jgi:integrase
MDGIREDQNKAESSLNGGVGTKGKRSVRQRNNIMRRGRSWYVRFERNGREVWRSAGPSREAAQELLVMLRAEADRVAAGLPTKPRSAPTLAEFENEFMQWSRTHKRSANRDAWCLPQLVKVFGHLRLTEITRARVEAFMRDRKEEAAAATINRQVALLRKVLALAIDVGKIDSNPLRGIKLLAEAAARQPTLEQEDEARLIAACPAWLAWAVHLALYTGCRQGELLALRWKHVDFTGMALIIEDSKSGESRRVFLSKGLIAELRKRRGLPEGAVITLPNGRLPNANVTCKAFKRAATSIGRRDLRFHDLRHVAGSRLLDAGASLPDVATVLGHKTLAIARRYAHSSPNRLRELMDRMPGANGAD